ncbi:MAG: glycosyltransferase [Chitinophagaceae bacterium]|nr:glycosyltransferase [Chitinophagaceae bacterium]
MSMLMWMPMLAFSLVVLIQVFYYLRYFCLLAFYRQKQALSVKEQAVSVIICARDEADQIEANLPGVLAQTYRSTYEIVVVNDNSLDDTKYLLEGLYRDFKQLHIVELKQEAMHIPGKKFPLSMGIKSAKYELLLLTDADCIPASEHWILKMQAAFADGIQIVLGYGAYKRKKGLLNRVIRFDTFHTALQYLSCALAGQPYMGVGRNLAYKKELFYRQKGFAAHHHLPGGDDDLFINACATKENTAIVIDKDTFTYSTPPASIGEWISQKERHNSTGKYYKGKHKFLLGLYMTSHFLLYPLMATALLSFDWRWVLGAWGIRFFVQGIVFFNSMKKLGEKDLFPFFWLWDIWMFFYYLIFISSIWKKPRNQWK